MRANEQSLIDPTRPKAEQIAELRQAVLECYCGFGPACPLWRRMTPAQRSACSFDKRATAQYMWKNGM
jgi:hypothetical protein